MTAQTCQNCAYCAQAKHRADYPMFNAKCRGCTVRGFAISLQFFKSERAGRLAPEYRHALNAAFGDDWQAAHDEIKTEAARVRALRMEGVLHG